jgi:hypothetical protein
MLTLWDFLALALIALLVVAAIRQADKKPTPSKDVTLDAMMARVAATGWHFALERNGYRIWHVNDFAGIKRELVAGTDYNYVAVYLHALGCLNRDETFAGCKPRYIPVDAHDDFGKPRDRLMHRAEWLYRRGPLTDFDIRQVVIDVLVRDQVDHPAFHALLSLARAFVSGRAVGEAEMAGLVAALDPQRLT